MASGSGKDQDDIQTQEPAHRERDHSSDAAAAAADAAEEAAAPPAPAPPSERLQESSVHGPPGGGGGGGGQSPSAGVPVEAATVPAESAERVDIKKIFYELLLESKTKLGKGSTGPDEPEGRQTEQVKPPKTSPEEVKKKSAWSKVKGSIRNRFSGRMGKLKCCSDENSIVMEPHVHHEIIPMPGIIQHYNLLEMVAGRGELFHTNALNLQHAYYGFRPVHGDGECFYRRFIFSYLEQVLHRQDAHEERRLLAVVKGLARKHARLALTSEFSRTHKAFKKLIKNVKRWKHVSNSRSYRRQRLLEFFSGYDKTNDIFSFLRIVAAVWICSHSEQFEPSIPELSEDLTLRDWCFREVIQRKVYTDHVQKTALATALGVPLRVEYLSQAEGLDLYTGGQDDTPRCGCWPRHRHHQVPRVTVLFSIAHYDIMYRHPPDDESSTGRVSLAWSPTSTDYRGGRSGESSGQQIGQGSSSSGEITRAESS